MLKLKCLFKRLRQLGLQIWCSVTKVRARPAGSIGDLGNFLIVLTKSPLLLPYISHKSRFFWLNSPGIMENSLNENVLYYVVNSIICGSKEARASIVLDIEWAQFVFQNGERLQNYRFKKGEEKHILFEMCMIKNRHTGIVLFSSDHMYKNTDKRYIWKTGLHTARFVAKIYLWSKRVEHKSFSKHKKTFLFFFLAFLLERNATCQLAATAPLRPRRILVCCIKLYFGDMQLSP